MNRRQMFKGLFATAIAAVLPIPAVLAWKERLSYSDIMRKTLSDPDVQTRMAQSIATQNRMYDLLNERLKHARESVIEISERPVRQSRP